MWELDRARLAYAVAGGLLAGAWDVAGVRDSVRRGGAGRVLRVPRLAERVMAAFAERPRFRALAVFLLADEGLRRAVGRGEVSGRAGKVAMVEAPARLRGLDIPPLATEAALAEWFCMSRQRMWWRADVAGRNRKHVDGPMRTYRYRWVERRAGGGGLPRLLEIPKGRVKMMQRQVLGEILNSVPAHKTAHGFVAGRSIVTNAAGHCGKAVVVRFDLADFFISVTAGRVFRIFRTLGYPATVARLLMGVCTTLTPVDVWEARPGGRLGADFEAWQRLATRHLPQGAPTSPALANLAAGRMDRRLQGLADAAGFSYTRYADDLTFSGGEELGRSWRRLEAAVGAIAREEGFALNHRKTRMMRAGARQRVAGVVVNVRPNVVRAEFDGLKAVLTNCVRHGAASQNRAGVADFRGWLLGKVSHVAAVHAGRGEKLRRMFARIEWG